MAINVDDYGQPMAALGGGAPKNLVMTNNGSDWKGPIYNVQWTADSLEPQYDPTTGQTSWLRRQVNDTQDQLYRNNDGSRGNDSSAPGGLPLALKKLAAGTIPAVVGKTLANNNGSNQLSPELQQLLAMALQRMTQQQPLFNAINAQAMAGLPTAYQR